ncbi:MAG TPA: nucleotidyltransferase family protein [Candidatus Polarisedimenticolia bacterium]|jgi:mannose-1-phosphate guanylyltransferase
MRRAVILAAGLGERLRPLTLKIPKCLLPINGRPLLDIWLEICRRASVERVLVNTHHLAAQVESFVRALRGGPEVQTVHEETLLGSAGMLARNRWFLETDRPFAVIYADTLIPRLDLDAMFRFHELHRELVTLGLFEAPTPTECGIVEMSKDGRIIAFEEKPLHPLSNLASAGVFIADPAILDLLPDRLPADVGRELMPELVGRMKGFALDGPVLDVGTPARYREAQEIARGIRRGAAGGGVGYRPQADRTLSGQ